MKDFRLKHLVVLTVFISVWLSCATTPPPKVTNDANVGISLSLFQNVIRVSRASSMFFVPEVVYFIRLDNNEKGQYKQTSLIVSNYKYDGFMADDGVIFALDLPPGEYAPVAAIGHLNDDVEKEEKFIVLFPVAAIEKARTKVTPGTIVYLGELYLKSAGTMKDADDVQMYYYQLFSGIKDIEGFWTTYLKQGLKLSNEYFIAPQFQGVAHSKELQVKFLEKYSKYFKETKWYDFFQRRLGELK